RLGWFSSEEVNDVAQDLGVKPETVLEMESRLSGQDIAYDGPLQDDEDQVTATPAGYLSDMRMEPATLLEASDSELQMKQRLVNAMQDLDERSREILEARWLGEKKSTLHELADRFQVSAERIRQIEKNAMGKLKAQLA
ncbi:MAG: sigma-70 family RNA polymerase sigma factor, partial [Candidatus Thiodiazotropha sp.]